MNTVEPMVVRSPLGWEPLAEPPKRRWITLVALVLALGVVVACFNLVLPYYAIAPGSASSVSQLISVPDGERHPARGQILFTTISLYQVRPIDAFVGWLRTDVDVVPRDQIVPPKTTDRQYQQINADYMDESKQTAIAVALHRLGYNVAELGDGARVEQVLAKMPSEGKLHLGDVIKAIDGKPITTIASSLAVIRAHTPGEVVHLDVQAPGGEARRAVDIELGRDPGNGNPILGVYLRTNNKHYDLPFKIDINSGSIGGPSAGLAFTLGVLDTLTPGELTGGRNVAVTGTIDEEGKVGPIGGVLQKESAVKASGAEVFLVPAGDYAAAKAHAGRLKVIKVTTLEEALGALQSLGGDLSALGPPPAGAPG